MGPLWALHFPAPVLTGGQCYAEPCVAGWCHLQPWGLGLFLDAACWLQPHCTSSGCAFILPPQRKRMGWQVLADNQLLHRGGLCSWLVWGEDQAHLRLQGSGGLKCSCIATAVVEVSSHHGKPKPVSQGAGKPEGEETDGCLLKVFAI